MSIFNNLKEQLKEWNNPGINVPLANDGVNGPSITLLFAYVGFIAAMGSLIYLHIYPDKLTPTIMAVSIWSIALLIYRMRKIDKLKFDLDDKSFEIEAGNEEKIKPKSKDDVNAK